MTDQELIQALREHAEWARANEWECPITLGDDIYTAIQRLEQPPQWIPVTERLPELQSWGASEVVLGLIRNENVPSLNKLHNLTLCVYCDNGIWSMPGRYVAITHWMPLPAAPGVEPHE